MAKVPTATEAGLGRQRVRPDQTPFQAPQTTTEEFGGAFGRDLSAVGLSIETAAGRLGEIVEVNDRLAVSKAMDNARTSAGEKMLGGLYSKVPSDLFADGVGPQDVYDNNMKLFDEVDQASGSMLNNDRQHLLFRSAFGKYKQTEGVRASSHIAKQFRSHTVETGRIEKEGTKEALSNVASQIEQDWQNTEKYKAHGRLQIELRRETGLTDKDAAELHSEWDDYVASSAVRGWFAASPNPLASSQGLASGKFEDEAVQDHWDALDPKQRKSISNDLIGRAQKLAQLQNDQREISGGVIEAAHLGKANDFFVMDQPEQRGDRIFIYDELKDSPHLKKSVKDDMRDILYGGPVVQDSEPGLVELEGAIRDGEITSAADASAFRYNGKQVATSETMRTRIFPLVESVKNKDFRDAMSAGMADLGVADTASETSSVLKTRVATFKSRFLRWGQSEEGRTGDPWSAVDQIVNSIKAEIKVDPATMTMLRQMKKNYNDSLAAGNAIQATASLQSIEGLMSILGITLEDIK